MKKKEAALGGDIEGLPYCCGVEVLGDLYIKDEDPDYGRSFDEVADLPGAVTVATTNRKYQKKEEARLRKLDFKMVREFKGNTGARLALWIHIPPQRQIKKGKKGGTKRGRVFRSLATDRVVTAKWAKANLDKVYG